MYRQNPVQDEAERLSEIAPSKLLPAAGALTSSCEVPVKTASRQWRRSHFAASICNSFREQDSFLSKNEGMAEGPRKTKHKHGTRRGMLEG
jgi:hypothetical protein